MPPPDLGRKIVVPPFFQTILSALLVPLSTPEPPVVASVHPFNLAVSEFNVATTALHVVIGAAPGEAAAETEGAMETPSTTDTPIAITIENRSGYRMIRLPRSTSSSA